MERNALKAIVLPFERQDLQMPASDQSWLFLNASPLSSSVDFRSALFCEQSFRPQFLALQREQYSVMSEQTDDDFIGALVLADRSKARSQHLVSRAVSLCATGAPIVVAGEKDYGISSLKKWVADKAELKDSFSKFHAQVFIFHATQAVRARFSQIETDPNSGIYGSGKIDVGSQLLAGTFDKSIKGNVADFGAGTGYLSEQLVTVTSPESLDLYEAEARALVLAEQNLASAGCPVETHWCDLTSEPVGKRFDWIIMNPPFHQGRAAEPAIGQTMIKAARKALRPGGKLRLVANRQLPYENTLQSFFGGFVELVAENGFKVLQARC